MSHHWMWAIFKFTKNLWKKYMSFKMYVIKNVTKCQSLGSNWYRYRFMNDRFCTSVIKYFFTFFAHTHLPKTKMFLKYPFSVSLLSRSLCYRKTNQQQQQKKHRKNINISFWFISYDSQREIRMTMRYVSSCVIFLFRCHNSHWRLLMLLLHSVLLILVLLNKFSLIFVISVFLSWLKFIVPLTWTLTESINRTLQKFIYFRALWHFKIAISINKFS